MKKLGRKQFSCILLLPIFFGLVVTSSSLASTSHLESSHSDPFHKVKQSIFYCPLHNHQLEKPCPHYSEKNNSYVSVSNRTSEKPYYFTSPCTNSPLTNKTVSPSSASQPGEVVGSGISIQRLSSLVNSSSGILLLIYLESLSGPRSN